MLGGCGRIAFDARDDGGLRDAAIDGRKFFVDGGECPPGYTFDTVGCYRFVPGAVPTWFDAEADCEHDAFGAHLVVIDSIPEAMAVDRQAPGQILAHYIGATDIVTEGTFLGVTNQPMAYVNWAATEPSGGTTKNCVLFFDDQTESTKDCTAGDDYMCEYDGIPAVPAAWGQ